MTAAYLYPIGLGFAKPDTMESACEKRRPGNLPGDGWVVISPPVDSMDLLIPTKIARKLGILMMTVQLERGVDRISPLPSTVTCMFFPVSGFCIPSVASLRDPPHQARFARQVMPSLDSLVPVTHFFSGCVRMFIGTSAWTPGSCVYGGRTEYGGRPQGC